MSTLLGDNTFFQILQWIFYVGGDAAILLYLTVSVRELLKRP